LIILIMFVRGAQVMNLIMQFSPIIRHFISLRSKYSPQHPVLCRLTNSMAAELEDSTPLIPKPATGHSLEPVTSTSHRQKLSLDSILILSLYLLRLSVTFVPATACVCVLRCA
jgi:hypothetical protein